MNVGFGGIKIIDVVVAAGAFIFGFGEFSIVTFTGATKSLFDDNFAGSFHLKLVKVLFQFAKPVVETNCTIPDGLSVITVFLACFAV